MSGPWRTRLIAVYSLAMGVAGWWLLFHPPQWDDLSIRVLLALALVASAVLLQQLTQSRDRQERRASESEALYGAEQQRTQQFAAIERARQEEAWTATALLQVAEAVGSLTSLDEILETVVRITPILVGVDRCSILLWQDEPQEYVFAKGYARQREAEPIFEALRFQHGDVPVLDQLRAHGVPIVLQKLTGDEWIPRPLVQEFSIGSLLALPLRSQGEIHGAMLVDYQHSLTPETAGLCLPPSVGQGREPAVRSPLPEDKGQEASSRADEVPEQQPMDWPDPFTDYKKTILSGIADQAGMAVANARLHDAQREEAWVSTALLQVAQAFISSADLHENASKIARLTPLLAGVDRCMIFLWERDRGEFVPYESHGLNKEAMRIFRDLHFKTGDVPLLDELMRRQSHVSVENAAESGLIPQALLQTFDIKSVLAVPLISRGEMLGAFLVDCTQRASRFSPRKISIVEGIADQMAVAVENARLYETLLEQERMAQELRLASEIQASFLPESCPSLQGWEIAADWHAAREVGGDFYDFVPLGRDRLGLVIADVSDKGVPAALFMSLSRTLVRASALEMRSPARVLQHVNDLIMADARSGMFVTMFYGVLNQRTGQLTYASAGHNPPVWWRRTESQMTLLTGKGVVLGVAEDIKLEERQVVLGPGDIVILYTDGVTEPINDKVEEFGEKRLMQVIADASDKPCNELVRLVHDAVSVFVGDQPQFDDYTLVGIKRQV